MKKIAFLLLVSINAFSQNFDYKNYTTFLQKYVSGKGNVSYDKIKANKSELDAIADQFQKTIPSAKWSNFEKMAYYINLYNVYTIDAVINKYPIKSIKDIPNVWDKKSIPLGKTLYSLSEIENKILRKMGDPRIHFAINCASYSCPKLENEAFAPEKLEKQLESASREFVNDKSKNAISEKEIKISNIFDWYAGDFKENGSIIDYLNKYSNTKIDKKAKTKFAEYNWALNK